MQLLTIVYFGVIFVVLGAVPAFAFDGAGHMQIADIAWVTLAGSAVTRAAIAAILKKARGQFKLSSDDPTAARDAFDLAATFPDIIKNSTKTPYESLIPAMNLLFWDQEAANAEGREGTRCRSWHFFDTPIKVPAGVVPHLPDSNLVAAVNEGTRRLRQLHTKTYDGPTFAGMTEDDLSFWWLAFLLHVVGDAHQPLHCASNYSVPGNVGKPDAGGNKFPIAQSSGKSSNLHTFWDASLEAAAFEDGVPISSAPTAASHSAVLAPASQTWLDNVTVTIGSKTVLNPTTWVSEGATAATTLVYKGIKPGQVPSAAYRSRATAHARQAAVLGGQRLAAILKNALA